MQETDLDNRVPVSLPDASGGPSDRITYRDYFHAIERVVVDHWSEILEALAYATTPEYGPIQEIRIIGEKHGSDYHPARIEIVFPDSTRSFVMNVALTPRGLSRIAQEFSVLHSFAARPGPRYVPKVYFLAEENAHPPSTMFLGEWFDGYHEFHLTEGMQERSYDMVLWDGPHGGTRLSLESVGEIFRQAAFILTWYYDPMTCKEVYPWHHAAGDFVARVDGREVSVKLIAARQHGPRVVYPRDVTVEPAEAALVFFANLTVRNRLDRLDGVGEVVFAGEDWVRATVHGFFDALRAKAVGGWWPADFPERFVRVAAGLSPADWADLFRAVVDSCDPDAPDVPVIMEQLADHVFQVYKLAQALT